MQTGRDWLLWLVIARKLTKKWCACVRNYCAAKIKPHKEGLCTTPRGPERLVPRGGLRGLHNLVAVASVLMSSWRTFGLKLRRPGPATPTWPFLNLFLGLGLGLAMAFQFFFPYFTHMLETSPVSGLEGEERGHHDQDRGQSPGSLLLRAERPWLSVYQGQRETAVPIDPRLETSLAASGMNIP